MSENSLDRLRVDPWVASSMLQKCIRRGEADLAQAAARILYRYRSAAIWHRLVTIAVEDIGIADLDLVLEVTRIGTDKALRSVLASDNELIADVTARLVATPKERSTDYLHSAARWKIARTRAADLFPGAAEAQVIEFGDQEPLVCEAARLLVECIRTRGGRSAISEARVRQLFKEETLFKEGTYVPTATIEELVERFARSRVHPFSLMLLPLWSAICEGSTQPEVSTEQLPKAEYVGSVPLYVLDKHTAIGKAAISRFARENLDVRRVLSQWVAPADRAQVAEMAAFYTDAVPVLRKFRWPHGRALEELGCRADMVMVGCPVEGVSVVLSVINDNLDELNAHRQQVLGKTRKVKLITQS